MCVCLCMCMCLHESYVSSFVLFHLPDLAFAIFDWIMSKFAWTFSSNYFKFVGCTYRYLRVRLNYLFWTWKLWNCAFLSTGIQIKLIYIGEVEQGLRNRFQTEAIYGRKNATTVMFTVSVLTLCQSSSSTHMYNKYANKILDLLDTKLYHSKCPVWDFSHRRLGECASGCPDFSCFCPAPCLFANLCIWCWQSQTCWPTQRTVWQRKGWRSATWMMWNWEKLYLTSWP